MPDFMKPASRVRWRKLTKEQRCLLRLHYSVDKMTIGLSREELRTKYDEVVFFYFQLREQEKPIWMTASYSPANFYAMVLCHSNTGNSHTYHPSTKALLNAGMFALDMLLEEDYYKIEVFERLVPDGGYVLTKVMTKENNES